MVGELESLHIEGQVGLGPNGPWASLSSGFKDHGTHKVVLCMKGLCIWREKFLFCFGVIDSIFILIHHTPYEF